MTEFTNDEIALMGQVLRIFDLFDEEFTSDAEPESAHRTDGPNPYYCVTESGLYLEHYYGHPTILWTPWGKWSICGGITTPAFVKPEDQSAAFLDRLTTEVYAPLSRTDWGDFGPIHSLLAVDNEPLPTPGTVWQSHSPSGPRYSEREAYWKGLVLAAQSQSPRGSQFGNLDMPRLQAGRV